MQWRHTESDGVSNHRGLDCLLNRLFRRRSKKISKPRVPGLCKGNLPVIGKFPAHKWPETQKMFPFNDVIMPCHHFGSSNGLNQCWHVLNWAWQQISMIFLKEIRKFSRKTCLNVVCEMADILCQPQCVNLLKPKSDGEYFANDIFKCISFKKLTVSWLKFH